MKRKKGRKTGKWKCQAWEVLNKHNLFSNLKLKKHKTYMMRVLLECHVNNIL